MKRQSFSFSKNVFLIGNGKMTVISADPRLFRREREPPRNEGSKGSSRNRSCTHNTVNENEVWLIFVKISPK